MFPHVFRKSIAAAGRRRRTHIHCSHTTIYVSSYYYIRVLILLCTCPHIVLSMFPHVFRKRIAAAGRRRRTHMYCSHTTIYVSSHYYIHVSSYSTIYMFPHIFRKRIAGAGRRRRRPSSQVATTTREKRRQRVRGALLSLSPTSIYNRLRQRTELI